MDWNKLSSVSDVEEAARSVLKPDVWAYVSGGAGTDKAVSDNVAAFNEFRFVPRIGAISHGLVNTRITLLGQPLRTPIILAPTSPQRLLHEDAELGTARACQKANVMAIVSTDSHYPFATISACADRESWFQLYGYGGREEIEAMLEMAVNEGAKALVITMDAHHPARRISAQKTGFVMPPHVELGNLRSLGISVGGASREGRVPRTPLNWDDLHWIRRRVKIPILIKGILCSDDARKCVAMGADGIIVSNHGGRQLDSVIPSMTVLAKIANAVRNNCAILLDSGVRSGSDVVKAIALGAHAVCIGRPYLWALAAGGETGVIAILNLLQQQLEDTLHQLGLRAISEVTLDCVAAAPQLWCGTACA